MKKFHVLSLLILTCAIDFKIMVLPGISAVELAQCQ